MSAPILPSREPLGRASAWPPTAGRVGSRIAAADPLSLLLSLAILTHVWRIQDLVPVLGAIKLPLLVSIAALGCYALDRDARRRIRTLRHPVLRWALALGAAVVFSIPFSVYAGLSFRFFLKDFAQTFVLMILLAASIRAYSDFRRYLTANLVGAAIYCLTVLARFQAGKSGRLGELVYYDANDLAMLIVCTLPIAIFFMRTTKRRAIRFSVLALIMLLLFTIIKTGSRGGFLGLLAVAGFMLVAFSAIRRRFRIAAVVGILGGLMAFGSDQYWSMMQSILHPSKDYNWVGRSEEGRAEIWKRGLGYMLSRPITGVGARAFSVAEGTISSLAERQLYTGRGFKWSEAHNSFVQIGAELGAFGLISLIGLLTATYRTSRRIGRIKRAGRPGSDPLAVAGQALCTVVVGYVVSGFFLSQGYMAMMFAIYGLVIGLDRISRAHLPSGPQPVVPQDSRPRRNLLGGALAPIPAPPTPGRV